MTLYAIRKSLSVAALAAAALIFSFAPAAPLTAGQPSPQQYLATRTTPGSAPLSFSSAGVAEAARVPTKTSNSVYFRETAHYVRDAFLNYWLMNGGVPLYGYPISEETQYGGKTVQYFERARFEFSETSRRPWKVELTNVGTILTDKRVFLPAAPLANDALYFEQTQHNLRGAFRQFWSAGGGTDIFGYPLSEEIQENGLTVQYFERARFETAGQGRVQLGRLGAELLARDLAAGFDMRAAPQPRPAANMSFWGEATWFHANWDRVISLNKGWGNLPDDYVGRGLYAAAPADLGLYGRWARVTRGNRSIFVQFIDVIDWKDIPYVRNKGIVIDLGEESYRALGQDNGGRYEVSFDVLWPDQEP